MILEEETFEKFGYYPSDLKPHSGKKIIVACDECEKIREIIFNQYRSLCRSCTIKGKNHPAWKGGEIKRICKQCSIEFSVKLSVIKKGNGKFCSPKCSGKWQSEHLSGENSPNWKGGKIKRICKHCGIEFPIFSSQLKHGRGKYCSLKCARKARKIPTHHTKPELIFEEICKQNNLPFHYVGDGQLWIGKNKKLNPDFIEANGKKTCVEIMGAYWHSPLLNKNLREDALQSYREKHYRKYKWIPVFIWDTDLLREDVEAFVLNILREKTTTRSQ